MDLILYAIFLALCSQKWKMSEMSTEDNMRKFSQSVHVLLGPGEGEQEQEQPKPNGLYVSREGANPPQPAQSSMAEFVKNLFDVPN